MMESCKILKTPLLIALVLTAGTSRADLVVLKNGKKLVAESVSPEESWMKISLLEGGTLIVPKELIDEIKEGWLPEKKEAGLSERARCPYRKIIEKYSREFSLDPNLVAAIIKTESNFNEIAVSDKGALGLMQLTPDTAALYEVDNPFDPDENIRGGSAHLKNLMAKFDNDLAIVLAAYNAGDGRIRYYGGVPPFSETKNYVKKVLEHYRYLKGEGAR